MYRFFRLSFAILGITLATRLALYAQGYDPGECAHTTADQHAAYKAPSQTPVVPTVGTFRALVVFVRFYDDTDDWTGSCWPNLSQWADPDQLPSIATSIISSSASPPFAANSITDYFYQQSEGQFVLFGEVYPEVAVSAKNQAEYGITGRGTDGTAKAGMAELTEEVVNIVTAAGPNEVNLGDFDDNTDGYLDHLFVIIRQFRNEGNIWSGFSILGASSAEIERDGVKLDWNLSGSFNRYNSKVEPDLSLVKLLAHEFGHDVWTTDILGGCFNCVHVQAVGGTNGVPANGTSRIGYALMPGDGSGHSAGGEENFDAVADLTISAWERDILSAGWMSCPQLISDQVVTLDDLYTGSSAKCSLIDIPTGSLATRKVYLTNR